jgi:hypothetical protein
VVPLAGVVEAGLLSDVEFGAMGGREMPDLKINSMEQCSRCRRVMTRCLQGTSQRGLRFQNFERLSVFSVV